LKDLERLRIPSVILRHSECDACGLPFQFSQPRTEISSEEGFELKIFICELCSAK
jgi:hypothetical protein